MSSLSQIYQESPGFLWESPLVKMNSAPVFPSSLLSDFFPSQSDSSLSNLNELSGELSHVSSHRGRQTLQHRKTVASMFALTLFIIMQNN